MPVKDAHIFPKASPDLVQSIRDGNHAAYELFYRMEFLNLVHFCNSYLKDPDLLNELKDLL